MADELTVPGDPGLVARDFGGGHDGRDVVLLHGLGGNVLHWTQFAPLLTPHHRVVALDLRCHGHSGDGPWHWEALLDDVERAVAHLGLHGPVVIGHSAGGCVAALWAQRHPQCPGAVDLDGIRAVETDLENYPGLDAATARRQREELTAVFDARARMMAGPLPDEQYEAMLAELAEVAELAELAEVAEVAEVAEQRRPGGQPLVEMYERNIAVRDGIRYLRPNAEAAAAFRRQLAETDFFAVFADVACPLMICVPTRNIPGTEQFADLLDAQRRGVDRDLAAVRRANPRLRVERLDASHGMVGEQSTRIAELVKDFLSTIDRTT